MLGYNEATEEIKAILVKRVELYGLLGTIKSSLNAVVSGVGDRHAEPPGAGSWKVIHFRLPDGELIEKLYLNRYSMGDDDMPEWKKLMSELGSDPVGSQVRLDFTGTIDGLVISGINVENYNTT